MEMLGVQGAKRAKPKSVAPFILFTVGGYFAFPALLRLLPMILRPGYLTVPITQTHFYSGGFWPIMIWLVAGCLIGIGLSKSISAKGAALRLQPIAFGLLILPISFFPTLVHSIKEQLAFSQSPLRETRMLHINSAYSGHGAVSETYYAVISPYHLTDLTPLTIIDHDTYDAIMAPEASYCLKLLVERVGSQEQLLVTGVIHRRDLQKCSAGSI